MAATEDELGVLLITHNVCGIFDHMESGALPLWVQELQALIADRNADFVALHMQEIGGASWKQGNVRTDELVEAVLAGFPEFWSSGLLCNTDTTPLSYSALGSLYLVRRSKLHRVRLWHFGGQGAEAGWRSLDALPSPLVASASLPAEHTRHERFPQTFFPEFPTWSRKGFLHTRWQLGQAACDLLNVHFFHDHCNLGSLHRGDNPHLSPYALSRQKALTHSMRALLAEAQGLAPAPCAFVFGDYNFRLDLAAVLASSRAPRTRAAQRAAWRACAPQPPSAPLFLLAAPPLRRRGAGDGGGAHGGGGTTAHPPRRPARRARRVQGKGGGGRGGGGGGRGGRGRGGEQPAAGGQAGGAARLFGAAPRARGAPPQPNCAPWREPRRAGVFPMPKSMSEAHGPCPMPVQVWRGFDVELEQYCGVAAAPLLELPLAFPPSYMRKPAQPPPPEQSQGASSQAEGGGPPKAQGGPAPPTALGFEGKRCPSWCDRVMMSANGLDLVKKSRAAAAYDSQLWLPCFSDHNKVYLSFSCA